MKQIIVSVSYRFDGNKAWADSYTDHAKHSRLEIDEKRFHKSLLEALAKVDTHIEFNKTQNPQPMYTDKLDGSSAQVGWVYRCSIEADDGKRYRGDAWVSINGDIVPFQFTM